MCKLQHYLSFVMYLRITHWGYMLSTGITNCPASYLQSYLSTVIFLLAKVIHQFYANMYHHHHHHHHPPPPPSSSRLSAIRCRSSGKSRSPQEIKAIYPSTLWMMCAVLITVICSSMSDRWPGGNWRFWSNHFPNVPNAPTNQYNPCPYFSHPACFDLQVFVLA